MHAYVRRALCAAGLTGGIVLLGVGLAEASSADTGQGPVTTGQSGILSGNQTGVDAQAPVNLSGNQVTVIGQRNDTTSTSASSTSSPGTSTGGSSGSPTTSGQDGIGSGNQTGVGVQAPVNVSGNQVTVIGQDNTTRAAGGSATTSHPSGSPTTSGQSGILSGNQTGVGVQLPIDVSGNQVTVIGQDNTLQSVAGSTTGGTSAGSGGSAGSPTTTGQSGIGSGNQTAVAVLAPINASGNQVTAIGQDNTLTSLGGSTTGTGTGGTTTGSPTTSGQSGILSGNQTGIAVLAPINASGNQVTAIGQDNTLTSLGGSTTGTGAGGTTTGSPTTSGQSGIGSGNQTGIAVLAPIAATGNQVTAIGQDNTVTSTGGSSTGTGGTGSPNGGGETTTGAGGIGSGNQTPIVVQVPVDTSGNQVTVIGQDNTDTSTSGSTSGGTTPGGTIPGGGVVSPPSGGVPPTGGTVSGPQGSSTPGTTVLPQTGLAPGLLGLALLGLLLVGLGSLTTRRTVLPVRAG